MNQTKIQFSEAEMELMRDANVILTKNKVISAIVSLFAGIQSELQSTIHHYNNIPEESKQNPKISKGENYLGLPYVMLDYPRSFDGKDIFAIRTMFWWGNFFSMTLHLSGAHKTKHLKPVLNAFEELKETGAYIGMHDDQWQHHFGEENYKLVSLFTKEEFNYVCTRNVHLKIAYKWPLEELNEIGLRLRSTWAKLMEVVNRES